MERLSLEITVPLLITMSAWWNEKYFTMNITKEGLEMIENIVKWPDIQFMKLDFPELPEFKQTEK
ncbi:MAG TPA: hypothetical protein VGO58_20230 [Chitinophagaceae bacterium]|jgi:hypothetical protein|nr:hypothetical protein [Chitinophagaceae bacterium]